MDSDATSYGEEIVNVASDIDNGEVSPEDGTAKILSILATTETEAGDVAGLHDDFGDEIGAISRALTSLSEKGLEAEEIREILTSIAYTQVQPGNKKYLDDGEEVIQATNIGRKIMQRNKKGGRPSKVDPALEKIEDAIEWYNGEQQDAVVKRELARSKKDMSRPTWKKFKKQADELLSNEVGSSVESYI